ncbi:unnamed protein product [Hermetia illucens]|uniref:Uncharacterized protein n=1 Tax=Hermetia illucens TaxID=343691 RepID=A0A7R8YP84_HERIL|nr:unnamed protein product [Hermetia illucens]
MSVMESPLEVLSRAATMVQDNANVFSFLFTPLAFHRKFRQFSSHVVASWPNSGGRSSTSSIFSRSEPQAADGRAAVCLRLGLFIGFGIGLGSRNT